MLTYWGIVTALTLGGGGPIVGGLWLFERRRSRRRNRRGKCATCGAPWYSARSPEPYLSHGRLVCEECGEAARRRTPWHFGVLGLSAGVATGLAVAGGDHALIVLLPVVSTVAMTGGAIHVMKLANRSAQRRIAENGRPDRGLLGDLG